MNIKQMIGLKKTPAPASNETILVDAVQLWEVRWWSRYDSYSGGVREELEAFLSKEAAEAFAASLKQAYALLRHTSGTRVTVEKGKS